MIRKPNFDHDTGAGRAGIDNEHRPGKSYSSHQVEDTGCRLCRTQTGYWEHDGSVIYGTEGQRAKYIATLRGGAALPKCTICDTCLQPLLDSGHFELFRGPDGGLIADLSDAARREVFALGARSALADYVEIRSAELPEDVSETFILPLDPETIGRTMQFARSIAGLEEAEQAGRTYAAAALAFHHVERDPGFDLAAAQYAADYPYAGYSPEERDQHMGEEKILTLLKENSWINMPGRD